MATVVQAVTGRLTFDAWRRAPETTQPYEILDGKVRTLPAPTMEHQWIVGNVRDQLVPFVREHGLGVVLVAPIDVLIQREPLRTRQPDVLFLSRLRAGVPDRRAMRGVAFIEAGPELVVEVLSPSNRAEDVREKLEDYRRAGVEERWLVDPVAETIEVLALSAGGIRRIASYRPGSVVRSSVLPALAVTVVDVFA